MMALINKTNRRDIDEELIGRKKWMLSNIFNGYVSVISGLMVALGGIVIFSVADHYHADKLQTTICIFMFCIVTILSRYIFMQKLLISDSKVTLYTVSPTMDGVEDILYDNLVFADVPNHGELIELQLYRNNVLVNTFLVTI